MTRRPFPLNAWYAVAWSHEVGRREPLARTVCNQRVAMWRKADGTVAALEDACWHRLAPLSLGSLEGDDIVCRYHGLAFNGDGACTHMPSQDTLNPSARVRFVSDDRSLSFRVAVARRSRAAPIPRSFPTCTGTTIRNGPATARPCSPNATIACLSTI